MYKKTYNKDGTVRMQKGVVKAQDSYTKDLLKTLDNYLRVNESTKNRALDMYKAMDTQTASEGGNVIDRVLFRGIFEQVRAQGQVAPLFEDLTMPSAKYDLPSELQQVEVFITPENTTDTGQTSYISSDATLGQKTLNAKKFTGKSPLSGELEEDAVIDIIQHIVDSHSKGIALALDDAIINGQADTTSTDSDISGNREVATAFDGLRHLAIDGSLTVDAGADALSTTDILNATEVLDVWATDESQLAVIVSPKAYLQLLAEAMNTSNNNQIAFGFNGGQLTSINNIDIVKSQAVRKDVDDTGVHSGTSADDTHSYAIVVNTSAFVTGTRSTLTLETDRVPDHDQTMLFSRLRKGFTPIWTPGSSYPTVCTIINIDS